MSFFFSDSFLWLCDTYCWQKGITCCHQLELGLKVRQPHLKRDPD